MTIQINYSTIIIGLILIIINIISFTSMYIDKYRASSDRDNRTPEGFLFFWSIFFGGIGILLGMYAFRHKTRKWYFVFGIPFAIFQNIIILRIILEKLNF